MGKLLELPKNKLFQIVNKNETEAEILLYDEIGPYGITLENFSNELKKLPASIKNINIRINSPGGDVFTGMGIFERMKQYKAKKTVYVDGLAASIASIIMLAGDEVIIGEGAMVMIHRPAGGIFGNAGDMEKLINILDKIEETMIGIYVKKMGASRSEISAMLDKETWLTSEESIKLKLADRVFKAEETLILVASAMGDGAKIFKNAPKFQTLSDIAKEKLNTLVTNIGEFQARK